MIAKFDEPQQAIVAKANSTSLPLHFLKKPNGARPGEVAAASAKVAAANAAYTQSEVIFAVQKP